MEGRGRGKKERKRMGREENAVSKEGKRRERVGR